MEAARKEKWKVKLVEAHIAETRYISARAAVAGKSHFGMTDPHLDGFMYDNTRIAHMHLGAVCRGGIHLISVYLISCEGMSERNRGILLDLARLIKAIRGPWVVMGDWNMPPEVLEAAGWVGEVEGKIVSPKLPTCKGSVIDYFVVDRRLMHAVLYVKRLEGFGLVPHYPVRMALSALPRKLQVRTLIAPRLFPAVLPAGCLSEVQLAAAGRLEEHSDQLEQRLGGWIGAAEDVLCDILGKEGQGRDRWRGRAHGPRFVWKSALGTPAKSTPFTTRVSRSWAKIVGWCATMKLARAHEGARRDRDHPLAWSAYVSRRRVLAARKWSWGAGGEGVVLKTFVHEFAKVDLWSDNGELTALVAWAEEEADKAGRKAAVE